MIRIFCRRRRKVIGPSFDTVGEALDWGVENIPHEDWQLRDPPEEP